jgi:hypothetical protein
MTGFNPAVTAMKVDVTGGNLVLVIVVALIALGALAMGAMFRKEVLAAGEGTENMRNIALAIREGADAYLQRQFRTLAIFAAIALLRPAGPAGRRRDGADLPVRLLPRWAPGSPPLSGTSACRWPSAPTCASPRRPTPGDASRR